MVTKLITYYSDCESEWTFIFWIEWILRQVNYLGIKWVNYLFLAVASHCSYSHQLHLNTPHKETVCRYFYQLHLNTPHKETICRYFYQLHLNTPYKETVCRYLYQPHLNTPHKDILFLSKYEMYICKNSSQLYIWILYCLLLYYWALFEYKILKKDIWETF